jgi:hypothetical protein
MVEWLQRVNLNWPLWRLKPIGLVHEGQPLYLLKNMGSDRNQLDLIFLGAKWVIHLSSDYRIIDGDQAPTNNKEGLPACSELAKPTLKSAKPTLVCSESARPISQSARPTTSTACPESAKPASQSAKLTSPASA